MTSATGQGTANLLSSNLRSVHCRIEAKQITSRVQLPEPRRCRYGQQSRGPWRACHTQAGTYKCAFSNFTSPQLTTAYLSKNGSSSGAPGVFLQSRMSSKATANMDSTWTPAARMRSLASLAVFLSKVPEASLLANTLYPASRRERARNAVQTCTVQASYQ